jgi:hypothetical protein
MVNASSPTVTFKTLGLAEHCTYGLIFWFLEQTAIVPLDSRKLLVCVIRHSLLSMSWKQFFMLIGCISVVRWLNASLFLGYSQLVPDNNGITMSRLWAKVTTQEKSEFENSERFHFISVCVFS